MIWESMALMTLFDLVIFTVTLASLWTLFSHRKKLLKANLIAGSSIVVLGLLVIGLFYLFDLFTMWILPMFTTPRVAMAVMEDLHLNYSWIIMLVASVCIFAGFAHTNRDLFSLIEGLEHKTAEFLDANAALKQEIAEREQAEEKLRQAQEQSELHRQELVEADKMIALGTLVSGVAHEINNPNHYIMLNVPILRAVWKDVEPLLEHRFREDPDFRLANIPYAEMREDIPELIEEILDGSTRIKHIVSELRNYSRRQSPQSMGRIAINDVVRSALTLLANSIKKATTRFSVDYCEELPDVNGNLRRLEQVVINLILNACQALSGSGQAVRVTTSYESHAEQVVLTVEDEGTGMPEADLARITDPFYTTKREDGGTGLGLAVAARIVDEHRGQLSHESEPGRGTTARLSLPVYVEPAPDA